MRNRGDLFGSRIWELFASMPKMLELASDWRQAVRAWQVEHQGASGGHPSFGRLNALAIRPLSGAAAVFIRSDATLDPRLIHDWLSAQQIGCCLHRCFLAHQYDISDYRRFAGLRFGFATTAPAMHFRLYWYRPVPYPPRPPDQAGPRRGLRRVRCLSDA